jgi:hypothetical protein
MLRIRSRRCQATRSDRRDNGWCDFPADRHPKETHGVSPIKSSTKVPLTVAPHPPTLRDVGHWLPCGIGKGLSNEGRSRCVPI